MAVFSIVNAGAPLVFENTQRMSAPALMLLAGMVNIVPASEPKLAGLRVTAALRSEQVAPVMKNPPTAGSLIMTAVPTVVTLIGVGAAGVGVAAAAVVMLAGVATRFVCVKENGPPKPPMVVFCKATRGRVLVSTQVMSAPATVRAAGMVTTLPVNVPKLAGAPVTPLLASVHVAAVKA